MPGYKKKHPKIVEFVQEQTGKRSMNRMNILEAMMKAGFIPEEELSTALIRRYTDQKIEKIILRNLKEKGDM